MLLLLVPLSGVCRAEPAMVGSKGVERLTRPELDSPVSVASEVVAFLGHSPHVCGQALRTTKPNSLSPQSETVFMHISLLSKQFNGLNPSFPPSLSSGWGTSCS